MKNFYSSNRSYDNWKSVFFLISWQLLLRKQIHTSQSCSVSTQTTVSLKYWSERDKTQKNYFCKDLSSTPLQRTQTLTVGSKCSESFIFGFLLPLVLFLSGFDMLNMPYFSHIPTMASLDILCSGPL